MKCILFHDWDKGYLWKQPNGNDAIDFSWCKWLWRVCRKCGKVEAYVLFDSAIMRPAKKPVKTGRKVKHG